MTTLPIRLTGPRSLLACSAALLAVALAPTVLSAPGPAGAAATSTAVAPPPAAIWSGDATTIAATAGHGAPTASPAPAPRGDDPSGAQYSTGLVASTVGQLLSPANSCTATVIGSDSGQVAVTAAHCVYIPRHHAFAEGFRNLPPGWVGHLTFQPGRTGTRAPFGTWTVEHMWVDRVWQQTGDPRHDVAFLRLAPLDGRTAQATLGAQAVVFGATTPAVVAGHPAVTALGYPVEAPFDGTTLRRCTTPAVATPTATYDNDLAMACRMTPGASGGPWLTQFNTAAGTGTVTAVTSFKALDNSGLIYAVPLGAAARGLYDAADRGA